MKRYVRIVLVVTAALLLAGTGGWTISNNSISVFINVAGK